MPGFREMANAVTELVELERHQMRRLEDMTYRRGFEPGRDTAFAGLRLTLAEGASAAQFLLELAPIELEFKAWLEERRRATEGIAATNR